MAAEGVVPMMLAHVFILDLMLIGAPMLMLLCGIIGITWRGRRERSRQIEILYSPQIQHKYGGTPK
jgi:hypothetical protein